MKKEEREKIFKKMKQIRRGIRDLDTLLNYNDVDISFEFADLYDILQTTEKTVREELRHKKAKQIEQVINMNEERMDEEFTKLCAEDLQSFLDSHGIGRYDLIRLFLYMTDTEKEERSIQI